MKWPNIPENKQEINQEIEKPSLLEIERNLIIFLLTQTVINISKDFTELFFSAKNASNFLIWLVHHFFFFYSFSLPFFLKTTQNPCWVPVDYTLFQWLHYIVQGGNISDILTLSCMWQIKTSEFPLVFSPNSKTMLEFTLTRRQTFLLTPSSLSNAYLQVMIWNSHEQWLSL